MRSVASNGLQIPAKLHSPFVTESFVINAACFMQVHPSILPT